MGTFLRSCRAVGPILWISTDRSEQIETTELAFLDVSLIKGLNPNIVPTPEEERKFWHFAPLGFGLWYRN